MKYFLLLVSYVKLRKMYKKVTNSWVQSSTVWKFQLSRWAFVVTRMSTRVQAPSFPDADNAVSDHRTPICLRSKIQL